MPKNKIVFTIVARNYYGLAQVLKESVRRQHDDVEFLVFIADGIPVQERGRFGEDAIDATTVMHRYVPAQKLLEMAFKYNLTEFCTAIKPFCFRYVFDDTSHEDAIYLDPDIFLFSSLAPVFDALATSSIVLTPHIVFPSLKEGKRRDSGIMATGIFNLGFVGLRRSPSAAVFLQWWSQRLEDQCFVDSHDALFTDQKWVDFVPALFPQRDVRVLRHGGANLAPWNFHERQVQTGPDGTLLVERRQGADADLPTNSDATLDPVMFVHFSGFDYKRLCEGEVAQYNIDGLELYPDLQPLIDRYMAAIKAQRAVVLEFMAMPYVYGAYRDSSPVISFHRRLYRSALESGLPCGDPFTVGDGSFHARLARHRLLPDDGNATGMDKSNKNNMAGVGRKLAMINRGMRALKRIIGFKNYIVLLRLMRPYSRAESQLHLIDPTQNKL